jgi:hypothetical protein
VSAAVVLGDDLHVLVAFRAISVSVLNAHIREVHLLVEVGQVALPGPLADFFLAPIRMAVVVGAVTVPLVKPTLVLALELVVEDDTIDAPVTVLQALRSAFVRAIDLDVVCELSLAFNAMPEGLTGTLIAVAMVFE